MIHDRVDAREVPPLTQNGSTSSAAARRCWTPSAGPSTTSATYTSTPARRTGPERTLLVITTDGMENASRHYDLRRVRAMIERQKARYGWEFLFLGANIDAVDTAARLGIDADRAANFHCDARGTQLNYEAVSDAMSAMRCAAPLSARLEGAHRQRFSGPAVKARKQAASTRAWGRPAALRDGAARPAFLRGPCGADGRTSTVRHGRVSFLTSRKGDPDAGR